MSLLGTTTGSSNADADVLRQELQRVHAEFIDATAANCAYWRHQGGAPSIISKLLLGRIDIAIGAPTAQTQANMLHEFFRTEQVAENTISNQQLEILNQMNSVAAKAMQGQRSMVMSEACAELPNLDEINLQLKTPIEEGERLHA